MSFASRTGSKVSHYEVHELVAHGGMGEVFRGTDLRLERPVALKFLRPLAEAPMREQLIREAHAAALLDHPNICTIFEVDETPLGDVFIAMAYYEGETLDRAALEEIDEAGVDRARRRRQGADDRGGAARARRGQQLITLLPVERVGAGEER